LGLFELIYLEENDRKYIQVIVSSGNMKPYYIKQKGMCSEGCYIRVGTSAEKMNEDFIYNYFEKRKKLSLINRISPIQDLTFKELEIYYRNANYDVGDNFLRVNIPFNNKMESEKENCSIEDTIIILIQDDAKITRKRLSEILDVSESTVYRILNKLIKLNKLERVGSNKDGYWRIK